MTEIDKWEYFDYKGKTIVVNVFNYDEVASPDNIQVNVYVAKNRDIRKNVSVHDVMRQIS
tara:strand:- start:102 stop:281 length:180 start_codon:yes stop_codon:yes gene_type:complete